LGFACGVFGQKTGLTSTEVGLMSIIIFAGSAQFIGISMLSGGASFVSIILTTFIVNLRHMLYSSALIPYLKNESKKFLCIFSYGITDETFAVNLSQFNNDNWDAKKALTLNFIANAVWVFSNVLGSIMGNVILIDTSIINYALIAMFIGLWRYHLKNKIFIITGILAGVLALLMANIFSNKLHIVLATIIAALIGCILEVRGESNEL
jgi:4-azaleucine resistance transporter AzlC